MERVISGEGITSRSYLDDIAVCTQGTLEDHIQDVRRVFAKLREYRLKVSREKLEICRTQISFIGYLVSKQGIEVEEDKVKAIREWPSLLKTKK